MFSIILSVLDFAEWVFQFFAAHLTQSEHSLYQALENGKRAIDTGVGNENRGPNTHPPLLPSPSLCGILSQSRHSLPQNAWGWQRMQCFWCLHCAGPLSRLLFCGEKGVGLGHRLPSGQIWSSPRQPHLSPGSKLCKTSLRRRGSLHIVRPYSEP